MPGHIGIHLTVVLIMHTSDGLTVQNGRIGIVLCYTFLQRIKVDFGEWKMQFVINKIECQGESLIITGNTTLGTIKEVWKYAQAPIDGKKYHVELTIVSPSEISISGKTLFPSVHLENENVIFLGVCEGYDNEVYYLRFDVDWIEMLDIDVITSGKKKGDYILFSANYHNIAIYPYTL